MSASTNSIVSAVTPNSDQIAGIVRNVLAIASGVIISHGFVNSQVWESLSGFIVTLVVFGWSIQVHQLTIQSFLGVIRAGCAAIGGYLLFKGIGNQATIDQVSTLLITLVPIVWSASVHAAGGSPSPAVPSPLTIADTIKPSTTSQ